MNLPIPRNSLLAFARFLAALCCTTVCSSIFAFDEVTPEQMALAEPQVDPEAAAEFFYHKTKSFGVSDLSALSSNRDVEFRLKIFKERALRAFTPYKMSYSSSMKISKLRARVTKPNGEEIYLDQDSIETEVSDTDSNSRRRVISFSLPNLEVGDIVDLSYQMTSMSRAYHTTYSLYKRFPSHRTELRYKPLVLPGLRVTYQIFNAPEKNWIKKKGDYYYVSGENLPADPDEEFSLPRLHQVPSVWFLYGNEHSPKLDTFWEEVGQGLYKDASRDFKSSKAIAAKLDEITKGSSSKLESLRRVYWFCQDEIANLAFGYGEITKADRESLPKKQTADQVLKNKMGRAGEIRALFGAFARALGFDVQYAHMPDKREYHFNKGARFHKALPERGVAVKVDTQWLLLNPGNPHLLFGHVEPWSAGSLCLVGNKKREAIFAKSAPCEPDYNRMERSGSLVLNEEGDLSGEIEIVAYGDFARGLRNRHHASSNEKWETAVVRLLQRTFKSEFTRNEGFAVENKRGSQEPIRVRFTIDVPSYAERSGDLLVIRPHVLWAGSEVRFPQEERTSDVAVMTPYRIVDKLKILLPEGYRYESGSSSAPLGENRLIDYKPSLKIDPKEGAILVERDFAEKFGYLPVKYYDALCKIYVHAHEEDGVAITISKNQ